MPSYVRPSVVAEGCTRPLYRAYSVQWALRPFDSRAPASARSASAKVTSKRLRERDFLEVFDVW